MIWTALLVALGLVLLPLSLDSWFHDRERFELRRTVYATPRQRWLMDNRNAGRFGSLALVFIAAVGLPTDYVQNLPTLAAVLCVVGVVGFLSFMAFQVLPHLF